jgi:hypothetical protein
LPRVTWHGIMKQLWAFVGLATNDRFLGDRNFSD